MNQSQAAKKKIQCSVLAWTASKIKIPTVHTYV